MRKNPCLGALDQFSRLTPAHKWSEQLEIVKSGVISEATARGFSVETNTGVAQVAFSGGLTAEHYSYFAASLTDEERGILAKGILENAVELDWHDWDAALVLFRKTYGPTAITSSGLSSCNLQTKKAKVL